jgi:transcriptional regulator with XRE-family HTH domain
MSSSEDKALSVQLGKRIRALRLKRGWTQVELGVNCNHLSRVHISDVERGVREIGLYKLRKIAKAFDTTMSRLLTGL